MKSLIRAIREQIDYGDYPERMDPGTERSLSNPETNLYGNNPAMPRGTLDVQRLASDRFKKVVDKLREAMGVPNLSTQQVQISIQRDFMSSVMNAKRIENQHTPELEELALKASLDATETPEGKYDIDAKLTGAPGQIGAEDFQFEPKDENGDENGGENGDENGDEEGGNQFNPENPEFDANILTKNEQFELEKHKRNIINGIISGASKKGHYIFQKPEIKARLDEIDPQLYMYYLKVMAINDYFYFKLEDMIQSMSQTGQGIEGREDLKGKKKPDQENGGEEQGGREEQGGGQEQEQQPEHEITVRGLLFPILCHEIVKGIEEALGKFGYSQNPEIATGVINQVDTLPNEALSLRIGPELVDRIRQNLPPEMFDEQNIGIKPFFYKILYEIPAKSFLELIGKVVSNETRDNTEASQKFKEIFQEAKSMRERYTQKRAQGNAPPIEPERAPQRDPIPDPEKPAETMDDKKLAGMGLNALNVEMNTAIDNENWELAQRIQKMIERKQGVHESLVKIIKKHISN